MFDHLIPSINFLQREQQRYILFLLSVDSQPVSIIKDTDPVYCIELPQLKEATEDSGAYVLLCWVNLLVVDDQCARSGLSMFLIYFHLFAH